MSAQVIDFPVAKPDGNGAREAMIDIALGFKNTSEADATMWSDYMLMQLWARGFMVVPINAAD